METEESGVYTLAVFFWCAAFLTSYFKDDRKQWFTFWSSQPVFPLRKFYAEQMFILLRTKRMQQRNHADKQWSVPNVNRAMWYKHTVLTLDCWKCARMR